MRQFPLELTQPPVCVFGAHSSASCRWFPRPFRQSNRTAFRPARFRRGVDDRRAPPTRACGEKAHAHNYPKAAVSLTPGWTEATAVRCGKDGKKWLRNKSLLLGKEHSTAPARYLLLTTASNCFFTSSGRASSVSISHGPG
jgi:hypothetical protein